MTTRIGAAVVRRIEEQSFPVPLALLTGGADLTSGSFVFSNHSWLIHVDGLTVLVDPCNGNGRVRDVPYFHHRDLPWLERLHAAGVTPDQVDLVFCTHLHNDHCGWNTTPTADGWAPTFPRARYLFTRAEYRRWDTGTGDQHPNTFNQSVFDECVRPVLQAGQARLVTPPHTLSPSLRIETAPGHTVGHALLRLESQGRRAYFTGDVFHHPLQITHPALHLPGCDDPGQAAATRRALAARLHQERAALFPAHFPEPHHGTVTRDRDRLVFVPAATAAG